MNTFRGWMEKVEGMPDEKISGEFQTNVDIRHNGGIEHDVDVVVQYDFVPGSGADGMASPFTYDGLANIHISSVRRVDDERDVWHELPAMEQAEVKYLCIDSLADKEKAAREKALLVDDEVSEGSDKSNSFNDHIFIPADKQKAFKREIMVDPEENSNSQTNESIDPDLERILRLAGRKI